MAVTFNSLMMKALAWGEASGPGLLTRVNTVAHCRILLSQD